MLRVYPVCGGEPLLKTANYFCCLCDYHKRVRYQGMRRTSTRIASDSKLARYHGMPDMPLRIL